MGDDAIKQMTERFLAWSLPADFNPDGGVSFQPVANAGSPHEFRRRPTGTNLFTYTQAEQMVRHMVSAGSFVELRAAKAALEAALQFLEDDAEVRIHSFAVGKFETKAEALASMDEVGRLYCTPVMDCIQKIEAVLCPEAVPIAQ